MNTIILTDEELEQLRDLKPPYPRNLLNKRRMEMENLRFDEKWSYQMIADRFNLSRERVRQIIGNSGKVSGGFNYGKVKSALEAAGGLEYAKNKTTGELAEELSLSYEAVSKYIGKIRHPISDGHHNFAVAYKWQEWASDLLTQKGIDNKLMPIKHSFNILALDDLRVGVRVATKEWNPPSNGASTSPRWNFHIGKKENVDVYLLIVARTEDVFVVPSKDVPDNMTQINFAWPTSRPEIAKWQHYLNRFDLIK